MRSQNALTATSIGTASSVPQMPQTKLQKISADEDRDLVGPRRPAA